MPKSAKSKPKKGKKDKKEKKNKKDKKDKKTKKGKVPPVVPEKPKYDPCSVECPIYYIFDVQKTKLSSFFTQYTGGDGDDYLFFKKESVVMKLFDELKSKREEEQRKHDALIDEIIMMYADFDNGGQ